jgi:site-specific DNA-methyltransferase (adenine-specific)
MKPVIIGDAVLHLGDCIEVMRTMGDNSVDSIVCDPPYELTSARPGGRSPATEGKVMKGFMGMAWDGSGIAYSVEMWTEALRVLKPGGHLLAFSGSRTYHRMTCAIEDAGFDIRDQIMWVYGSGFPKSKNLDGQWEGWGTALKPAHEPICVARKPLIGTVAVNVLTYGTGALNIDGCRVSHSETLRAGAGAIPCRHDEAIQRGRDGEASAERRYTENGGTNFAATPGPRGGDAAGRWPANLIHDGSDEVVALFPNSTSGAMKAGTRRAAQDEPGSVCYGTFGGNATTDEIVGSSGSAARFFYCAKASRADRNAGTDQLPQKKGGMVSNTSGQHITRREEGYQAPLTGNNHPTVKPTDLMAYLVRLVTPPGGLVLDPFMGSGSTGKACMREGMRFIGCELSAEYLAISAARITDELAKPLQKEMFA